MKYKNAKFTAQPNVIDCEIEHPVHGWIPFTANPNDVDPLGAQVFNAAKNGASAYVEPPVDLIALVTAARTQRDRLLSQSDWTQVSDATVDQTAWATYRHALRDVPAQAGFPENIDWPVAPE